MVTKAIGEKVGSENIDPNDYFEFGAVLARKKLYIQATSNYEKCVTQWNREDFELAQVYNALGYAYLKLSRIERAITAFIKAVNLQPGYVLVWNNLGNVFEKKQDIRKAFRCYNETLNYNPKNAVALRKTKFFE